MYARVTSNAFSAKKLRAFPDFGSGLVNTVIMRFGGTEKTVPSCGAALRSFGSCFEIGRKVCLTTSEVGMAGEGTAKRKVTDSCWSKRRVLRGGVPAAAWPTPCPAAGVRNRISCPMIRGCGQCTRAATSDVGIHADKRPGYNTDGRADIDDDRIPRYSIDRDGVLWDLKTGEGYWGAPLDDGGGLFVSAGMIAAKLLPSLRGLRPKTVAKVLAEHGFKVVASKPEVGSSVWLHPDGSKAMIHPYARNSPTPSRAESNAHVHLEIPGDKNTGRLGDRGIKPIPREVKLLDGADKVRLRETHIGIRNPKDFPIVRGRPHGSYMGPEGIVNPKLGNTGAGGIGDTGFSNSLQGGSPKGGGGPGAGGLLGSPSDFIEPLEKGAPIMKKKK